METLELPQGEKRRQSLLGAVWEGVRRQDTYAVASAMLGFLAWDIGMVLVDPDWLRGANELGAGVESATFVILALGAARKARQHNEQLRHQARLVDATPMQRHAESIGLDG